MIYNKNMKKPNKRSNLMITINFYRFISTPEVVKLKTDHKYHNVFRVTFDHECHNTEDQLPIDRARTLVRRWLEDHYGFCVIHIDNLDEWDKPRAIKVCNHKKFIKDMHNLNMEVTVKGLT